MCNLVGILWKDQVLDVSIVQGDQGGFKEPTCGVDCIKVEPDTAVQTQYYSVLFVEWINKEIAYVKQSKMKVHEICWQSTSKINLKTASSGSW